MSCLLRIQDLKKSILETAVAAGKDPEKVRLVIVTKTVAPDGVREAYDAGERDFGENRVQEWQEKKEALPADIRWHLIGHLQTNKVKYVVGHVALIHSLDRPELAAAIDKHARAKGVKEVACLLQVNMSREATKSGCAREDVAALMDAVAAAPSIVLRGIMTIGPLTEDAGKIRDCFRRTGELLGWLKSNYSRYPWEVLSMGMSGDYKIAIEEGANMLRIGSLIFPRTLV
ncbi:MAG: YggS family pyridoxal phosphate-dependent enzyme [Candidatus Omnitrophica bacterium]|nr:YggS family pyridoxal phosphate-dependent enzyme [Candidatus Omnitrophota bacterium]